MPFGKTVPELVLNRVAKSPDREAFSYPDNTGWKRATWRQFGAGVRQVAMGLRALGLKDEQRVSIFSSTPYDWIVADLGGLCGGGATTTIYPSNTPEEAAYIIRDSGSAFVFCETDDPVERVVSKRSVLPALKNVITFDGKGSEDGFVVT